MTTTTIGQPWHDVRIHFPAPDHWYDDAIRGVDESDALANAYANWSDADQVVYVGLHPFEPEPAA